MNALGIDKTPADTTIVAAMSGGVDSAVTAALLVEAGYRVIGITLQLYDDGAARRGGGSCCAGQDIHDARRVADALDIDHYVLDYESRFREAVIDDFADAYARGETPIPCVRCNQTVKFRDLLGLARDLEADAVATGHYVRRADGAGGPSLHRAKDRDRDQSYFLFATTPEQLAYLRFPLGDLSKAETRAVAGRLGLAVADKPDSQDICFVPEGSYADIVARLRPEASAPGDIVDLDGTVLGRHRGIIHYTVGQRRGLGLADGEPWYVVRLEAGAGRVVVGRHADLLRPSLHVGEVNWLAAEPLPADGRAVHVKLRSTQEAVGAVVSAEGPRRARVDLDGAQAGIAPGQACVFYDGDRVLGGGWIRRPDAAAAAA